MQQYCVVGEVSSASRTDNYAVLSTLGRGTYGVCYKVQHKGSGEVRVMKAVSLQGLSAKDVEDTLNEARLMHRLRHQNIIQHIDSWCESQWLFIIMEYAEQGDLGAVVAAGGAAVPESDVLRYIADIAQGLKYLHDNYVLHRDIKPSNIFLVGGKAVIADLGLGRLLSSPSALAYSKVGTPLYFSPELCEEKPYDEKSDVWAFGCLIYELATGKPPFTAANQVALARKVVHDAPPPLPPHFSAELGILVHSMLQKNPAHRVSVADILEFPIVRRWVEQLSSERAAPGRHAAPDSGVTAEKLEAEYQERRQLLEEAYQAKLLAMEEMFQQRVEEAEAAALLARAEEEEEQRQALEEAEKQITTLQERNAALQEEIDGSVAEVHMLRDSEAQGLRVRSQLDEALQQLTAKLVNKEADCFRAAEEADSNRKRAEGLQVELEKSRKVALQAEEQLRAQLKEREAEVEGLQLALEQSRSDVETKLKMLTDYEHLFSMLQEETHGASSLPRSQTCSEGGVEQDSALPLTTDGVPEATDQDEAAAYHSSELLELSSQSEPSRQIGKSSPSDEFSLGAKSTSCPVSVVDTKEPAVASESHVVDETDCKVGPSLLESLLADADVMQYYSRQQEAEGDSKQSTQNCLGEHFVGWEFSETSVPDPRHTEECCVAPASTLEQECGLKQMVSNTEAESATMESQHRSEAPSDGAAAELEDEYLMASPTSSCHSASPFISSTDRKATHECARDGTREAEGHEQSSFGNCQNALTRSSSSDASSNERMSECSFEGESKSRCSRDNSENDQEYGEAVAEKTGCLPSASMSIQDCSYDELLIDGEPATPLAGSAKPDVRQTAGGSESGDSVEAVVEVTVHCESARAIFSSQEWRGKHDNGKQWQRPLTPQIENRNLRAVSATEAAEHHVSPRPMSAALGAIASAKARENEGLDDSDSEQTGKQGKAEMTPVKGIIRTRCVSLDQLGVTPTSSHKSASPSCHRATTFPVLLAWRKQPGAIKGRVSEPSPLRIANTVQQLAWGNKERYSLSAGGESSLAILFRPAGARTPSIRKILARRGCNAEFVRLDTAPTQCLQSQFSWRLVQAVLPHTVPAAARLVRAGNPTGELVEIIVEFGNPNAIDELLVLRSDARLRELLSSAPSSGQKAAHSSASPVVGGGGVSAQADRVEPTASLHCAGASVGASLSRRGRVSPQTRQQVRRPMSAASVPSTSHSKRVQQALPRRASSPSPRAHNPKEVSTDAPRCSRTADDVVCEMEPHRKQWPLSSAQVALLLDRVSRVAKEQESSRRAEGAGREEAVGPAVDTRTEVADVEGGEACVSNVCERPEQVMKTGSAESSPECTPKRVGAAEATVELLRHLDYVGQVAAVSQKLIELVTTPATSPQKGDDGKQVSSKATQQPRGRSPLSPTSRGNVAHSSASRGTRSFKRQGRSTTASTDGLRTSSDALCMEAVYLQDRLRAAMHCLGSNSRSPRLEVGKVASSSTVSRRGRSPSFNRGKSSTRAKS